MERDRARQLVSIEVGPQLARSLVHLVAAAPVRADAARVDRVVEAAAHTAEAELAGVAVLISKLHSAKLALSPETPRIHVYDE